MFNHLYNVFPDLLNFSALAPLLLRIILAIVAINLGYLKLTSEKDRWLVLFQTINFKPFELFLKIFAVVEIIGGIMLIFGVYTQIVAIIFALIYISEATIDYEEPVLVKRNLPFYLLLCAISISLILTGAGLYAIDRPFL